MIPRAAILLVAGFVIAAGVVAGPARDAPLSFHLMQVTRIVGGVNGDTTRQAIELRMRAEHQHELAPASLWALDANGQNPVLIVDFEHAVEFDQAGAHVLIATPGFYDVAFPPITPDFIMNPIPRHYLDGGSLVFTEDIANLVLWRVSWGTYVGDTTGTLTNDLDGEFGPVYPDALPSKGLSALAFLHKHHAFSTTNEHDYLEGSGIVSNNSGHTALILGLLDPCAADCGNPDGIIDIHDLLAVLTQYFTGPPQSCDFWPPIGDGQVDTPELQLLLENWGPCEG